jgi:hypothetical protein
LCFAPLHAIENSGDVAHRKSIGNPSHMTRRKIEPIEPPKASLTSPHKPSVLGSERYVEIVGLNSNKPQRIQSCSRKDIQSVFGNSKSTEQPRSGGSGFFGKNRGFEEEVSLVTSAATIIQTRSQGLGWARSQSMTRAENSEDELPI